MGSGDLTLSVMVLVSFAAEAVNPSFTQRNQLREGKGQPRGVGQQCVVDAFQSRVIALPWDHSLSSHSTGSPRWLAS